jgi:glutamate--cysteine ligase
MTLSPSHSHTARRPVRIEGRGQSLIPRCPRPMPPDPSNPGVVRAGFRPELRLTARPIFEPGGQLELARLRSVPSRPGAARVRPPLPRLQRSPAAVLRLSRSDQCVPLRGAEVPLRTPTTTATGQCKKSSIATCPHGPPPRRMMRLTASLQVTVDLLPGRAGIEQKNGSLANLAGRTLTAAFANSSAIDEQHVAPGRAPGSGVAWIPTVHGVRRPSHRHRGTGSARYLSFAAAAPRLSDSGTADPGYHNLRPFSTYVTARRISRVPLPSTPNRWTGSLTSRRRSPPPFQPQVRRDAAGPVAAKAG